jgi:hypothetical protein
MTKLSHIALYAVYGGTTFLLVACFGPTWGGFLGGLCICFLREYDRKWSWSHIKQILLPLAVMIATMLLGVYFFGRGY